MTEDEALRVAEALIFASAEPVGARALSQLLPEELDADVVLAALRKRYAGRGVELVEAGGGVQFRTAADLAPLLRKVIHIPRRLPRVAMETLAIIAYRHRPPGRRSTSATVIVPRSAAHQRRIRSGSVHAR